MGCSNMDPLLRLRTFRRTGCDVLLLLGLAAGFSMAQAPTGEIRLEVRDPSGAPMQASGTLESAGSGIRRAFDTNEQGRQVLSGLPFGVYQVHLTRPGFTAQTLQVAVRSATPISRTVTMTVSSRGYRVDVVAATPLPGTDLDPNQIPAPVQTASAQDLDKSGSRDLSDFLNRRLNGVYVNENQENPFQPDVNYRGYTASPLLGTPEGLSVYMDGVRQNQPFGDVVAWDLIPKIAIQETTLIPGSNPLFGLNTLGGAVSIQTKDGVSHPGGSLAVTGGMYGRRAAELEYGGFNDRLGLNWYGAGNLYREDGWRQFSPSEVRQSFGKLGWQRGKTSLSLSFAYADNWLTGNGLQDARFLAQNYSSVYTIPDITWNHSPSFNLSARHSATAHLSFSGNAYFRFIRADTTNGDLNSDSFDQSLYNLSAADIAALTAAGYSGFPTTGNANTEPFPFWRCIAQGLEKDEPSEKCTGIVTRTETRQNNYGLSGQAAWVRAHNHFTAGTAWDRSSLTFVQGSQFGYLNSDHVSVTPINAFADGSTNSDGVPVDTRVNLHGLINTVSFFASDTLSVGTAWNFTVSGRYNRTSIDNTDRLPPGVPGSRGSLNGQYVFDRFNPAAGLTYSPSRLVNLYFNYSESSRAPTATELGCADPNQPCNLPNALVSDPPLKQVVTRTFEAGVRGKSEGNLRWSVGWFRGENHNDLLFVASEQTGFGYFTNFGQTRRQGAEVNLSTRVQRLTLGGGYTFLDATYESPQTVDGGSNSSNDSGTPGLDGDIAIRPGDRLPQIPQHMLKAYAEYQPVEALSVDLDFLAVSSSYARGNENNQDKPDGVYYLGPGTAPGYGVLNLGAHYRVNRRVELFAEIHNLLDHHYYTAAQLGPTPYAAYGGALLARPFPAVSGDFPIRSATFYAPGAPLTVSGGLRFRF